MRWRPNSTVATIIEKDGRFLLVEEKSTTGELVINQPAGHIEEGESLIEAAIRETLEETGWDVQIDAYLGLYVYPASNGCTYHRHCFIGQALQHHPDQPLDTVIVEAKWLTLDELIASGQARSPLVIQCIKDYLDNKRYPLDIIYEHPVNDRS